MSNKMEFEDRGCPETHMFKGKGYFDKLALEYGYDISMNKNAPHYSNSKTRMKYFRWLKELKNE